MRSAAQHHHLFHLLSTTKIVPIVIVMINVKKTAIHIHRVSEKRSIFVFISELVGAATVNSFSSVKNMKLSCGSDTCSEAAELESFSPVC